MTSIVDIEGIGPAYAEKLGTIGIKTVEAYLEAAKDPKGRKEIAEKTGISDKLVLAWANKADLFRIKGVASQLSDLLEAAGVDTVKELKHRNAANLHAKMVEVNEAKKLVRQIPSETQVAGWIEEAKTLPAMLTY